MTAQSLLLDQTTTIVLPSILVPTKGATQKATTVDNSNGILVFEASISGAGAVSATVLVYPVYSVNPVIVDKSPITLTLSGTGSDVVSSTVTTPLSDFIAVVSAISGTGATVNAKVIG